MSLSNYITVSIRDSSPTVTQAGFGTALIFGPAPFAERVKTYQLNANTLSTMVADGFATTSPTYQCVEAIINLGSQQRITQVKIGRRSNPTTQTVDLTPTNTDEGYVYSLTVGAETFTVTVQSGDAVADVCGDLATEMGSPTGAWTATDGTTKVTITADAASTYFPIKVGGLTGDTALTVEDVTPDTNIAADMAEILAYDSDWYCCIVAETGATTIKGVNTALNGLDKMVAYQTQDTEVKSSSVSDDVASSLSSAADIQPVNLGLWRHNTGDWANAAWAAHMLPYLPGEANWAFKFLTGVEASARHQLSESHRTNLDAKYINYYVNDAGNGGWTYSALASQQSFIDLARGKHWVVARIREAIAQLQLNSAKIPFTDPGIKTIGAAIEGVLRQGAANGLFVDSSIVVTTPKASEVSAANRANRLCNLVSWSATFQGAVNTVTITGDVTT